MPQLGRGAFTAISAPLPDPLVGPGEFLSYYGGRGQAGQQTEPERAFEFSPQCQAS